MSASVVAVALLLSLDYHIDAQLTYATGERRIHVVTGVNPQNASYDDLGSPCGGRGSQGRGQHRRSLLETTILVSLLEDEAHGYSLMDRIEALAGSQMCVDPGSVYRTLRGMEQGGHVVSSWQEAESGPARRTYAITAAGRDLLAEWAQFLETRAQVMSGLAALAREHLSIPPTRPRDPQDNKESIS